MFHKHKWVEIERFYAPPISEGEAKGCSFEKWQEVIQGVTTILYECRDCHVPRTVKVLGKSMKE